MAAVRVALVGYGFAGRTFHAPLIAATPGLHLAVVCSRDAGKVHADWPDVAVEAKPAAAFARDDVDLAVIATPNPTHFVLAGAALAGGLHVVVDKPFTVTLAEARALAEHADTAGRVLSVFHNRRWDSDFLGIRAAIAAGLVGRVTHFESHVDRFRPQVRARWREQAGAGSGLWYDLGPHLVDQALQLFGLPDSVTAAFATQRDGGETENWAHVRLDHGRCRVLLHASLLVAGGSARFTVHGDRGSLVKQAMDGQEAQLLAGMRPGTAGWGEDPDPIRFHDGGGPAPRALPTPAGDQRRYYMAMRDAIEGNGPNPVTPLQAIAVMAVLEAGAQSAREQRSVPLPLHDDERGAWAAGAVA